MHLPVRICFIQLPYIMKVIISLPKLATTGFKHYRDYWQRFQVTYIRIKLEFLKYLPDNMFEPYKVGDILLSFKKEGSKLITNWGEIQPLIIENGKAGEYFELSSPN